MPASASWSDPSGSAPAGRPLVAAVESGGTKFVCALGSGLDDVRAITRIATTTPARTLGEVIEFFRAAVREAGEPVSAVGVATFGPADVDPSSPTFGYLRDTPKPGWSSVDLLGTLRQAFPVPVGFDTDVNGAALAEARWGAGKGARAVLYLTVGTGIGGGLWSGGRTARGRTHPEMGHVFVPRPPAEAAAFAGTCPFHGDCLEGLASGTALAARWGRPAEELPDDHPAWDLEVEYLARALTGYACVVSPDVMVIGGGVGMRTPVRDRLGARLAGMINGYLPVPRVVPPGLGGRSGVLGAIALGLDSLAGTGGS